MTDDEDFESVLKRYSPAEPSAQLRQRILGTSQTARKHSSLTWQLVAAAALLLIGAGLQAATARIDQRLWSEPPRDFARRSQSVDQLNVFFEAADLATADYLDELLQWPLIERIQ